MLFISSDSFTFGLGIMSAQILDFDITHPQSGNTHRPGTASADEKATPKCQICRQLTHGWAKRVVKFRERNGQEAGEWQ